MVNEHMKRCSTPLAIGEIKIKVTIRDHYTPTKMANIKKIDTIKC